MPTSMAYDSRADNGCSLSISFGISIERKLFIERKDALSKIAVILPVAVSTLSYYLKYGTDVLMNDSRNAIKILLVFNFFQTR